VIEKAGTERVAPSRGLFDDRLLGSPLGEARNGPLQTAIIILALDMLSIPVREPLVRQFARPSRAD
jgi:hypothetical protein